MKKIQILGLAIVAVCAFSVITAASASATLPGFVTLLAEWLLNKEPVNERILVESGGELLLEDNLAPIVGKAAVLCNGVLDGWIEENGLDEITELLTLGGAAVPQTALTGTALLCKAEPTPVGCEESTTDIEVWAIHLPWLTELELVEFPKGSGLFIIVDLLLEHGHGAPGWYVSCLVLGVKSEDTCTANTQGVSQEKSVTGGVEGTFSEKLTLELGLENATCSLGGPGSGVVEGAGVTPPPSGHTLTVSSEGTEF
jgi:hypothetical protein